MWPNSTPHSTLYPIKAERVTTRDFDAGVGAEDGDGLRALFRRDGQGRVEHERGDQGAVFAAAEADEPWARVGHVKLPQIVFDFLVRHGCHRGRR